jgi:hypothetical protein
MIKNPRGKAHGYHIVSISPWPICVALILGMLIIEFIALLQEHIRAPQYILFNIILLNIIIFYWGADINIEGSYEGRHTKKVQKLLTNGFYYFILSEAMFFGSLFSTYLYISSHPSIWIGCEWPPSELFEMDPMTLPLANAFLLIMSGIWGELSHSAIFLGLGQQTAHYITL